MDKRMMLFKLMSYTQARNKAMEVGNKSAIKCWNNDIQILQQEIKQTYY